MTHVNQLTVDECPLALLVSNCNRVGLLLSELYDLSMAVNDTKTEAFELLVPKVIDMVHFLQADKRGITLFDLLNDSRSSEVEIHDL